MTNQYGSLNRAQLSFDYLHTNSTTHEFLFGALAELVDNARDATATRLNIYTTNNKNVRGGFQLCFLDDGEGMSAQEASDIITFGKSLKKSSDANLIGMYGNGLKSGSMRIGNDLIMFTKKGATMTCVMLSRTFHEKEGIDEIIVPMPTFETTTKKPHGKTPDERAKHAIEMDVIAKYSPFKDTNSFLKEFDKIEGKTGTLIIIYNMKLLDNGQPELDVTSSRFDILLANPDVDEFDSDEGLMPERKSFRAYASILYVDPRMRIYIQGKKVRTKRLVDSLYKPRMYRYSSARFKTRSEVETKKAQEDYRNANHRAQEAESKARDLENRMKDPSKDKELRAELRNIQNSALELRKDAIIKKQIADRKTKSSRTPKTLNFIFGVNISNRNQDGMFIYNCSRLIKMYQKVGPQNDGGVFCSGVVGIVDVPYMVLEPTHNKQDFADAKEFRHLQKALGEHVVQYWKDIGIAQQGVTTFWENFGYTKSNWKDPPSMESKFIRKRAMQLQVTLQCDLCLKWRMLPFSTSYIGKEFPDNWVCNHNPDPTHNRCSALEQKLNVQEGVFKKEYKSAEQRHRELENEIQRKQQQLNKISSHKSSTRRQRRSTSESEEEDSSNDESQVRHKTRTPQRRSFGEALSGRTYRRSSSSSSISSKKGSKEFKPLHSQAISSRKSSPLSPPGKRPIPKITPAARQAQRKVRTPSGSVKEKPRNRIASLSDDNMDNDFVDFDDDLEEPPVKKLALHSKKEPEALSDSSITKKPAQSNNVNHQSENRRTQNGLSNTEHGAEDGLDSKVKAKIDNEWFGGIITEVDSKESKWKVKFDCFPQDKHDKWFSKDSADIKLLSDDDTENLPLTGGSTDLHSLVPSTASSTLNEANPSTLGGITAPNSASGVGPVLPTVVSDSNQSLEDIANGYRTCLRYFLPPQWKMDKDAVSELGLEELTTFPLNEFFDHYEKGLRKLVSSFSADAAANLQESEASKSKLSNLRKMIAKLLKSINEEFDIDPDCDTEQVDELLAACLKQAMQEQNS